LPKITNLKARLCYNSRGEKTVEIDVISDNKYLGRAMAPSGASTGKHEVMAFPNGIENAIRLFNEKRHLFLDLDPSDYELIYNTLRSIDNTYNYSIIGGSIAFALSIAITESGARSLEIPLFRFIKEILMKEKDNYTLPYPLGNALGGGAHAGPGTPDIQEFLVVPIKAKSIRDALEINFSIHKAIKNSILKRDKTFTFGRGDEGGWAPKANNEEALFIIEDAINELGYKLGKDVALGIDFASSSLWDENDKVYLYRRSGIKRDTKEQIDYVSNIIKDYKLIYAEDPLHEEAFDDMAELTKRFNNIYITGDDLLVTNLNRLRIAINKRSCNSAILKVNQAGTLYDALRFANEARNNGIRIITSHRSGESTDAHIAHIAIATSSSMLKAGIIGGERIAKLNELIRINEENNINSLYNLNYI